MKHRKSRSLWHMINGDMFHCHCYQTSQTLFPPIYRVKNRYLLQWCAQGCHPGSHLWCHPHEMQIFPFFPISANSARRKKSFIQTAVALLFFIEVALLREKVDLSYGVIKNFSNSNITLKKIELKLAGSKIFDAHVNIFICWTKTAKAMVMNYFSLKSLKNGLSIDINIIIWISTARTNIDANKLFDSGRPPWLRRRLYRWKTWKKKKAMWSFVSSFWPGNLG